MSSSEGGTAYEEILKAHEEKKKRIFYTMANLLREWISHRPRRPNLKGRTETVIQEAREIDTW
jgi:hypothetical protein